MKCMTWSRDTHGLFDYESNFITKWTISSSSGGKIIRIDNDVEFINSSKKASEFGANARPLIQITEHEGTSISYH